MCVWVCKCIYKCVQCTHIYIYIYCVYLSNYLFVSLFVCLSVYLIFLFYLIFSHLDLLYSNPSIYLIYLSMDLYWLQRPQIVPIFPDVFRSPSTCKNIQPLVETHQGDATKDLSEVPRAWTVLIYWSRVTQQHAPVPPSPCPESSLLGRWRYRYWCA